ncbi:UDP-N-acetylmuramoyl-tripeptide--D-alanyl-D-alanine ligase [Sulfurospirillum diekertiae]|uniref:UDP-N-acetylmuramoyl-tripeptide--D-alanyl-D-alanine ligase n=1 Tax=Sulfurospirillum diekertiae TaxID=1854492 RepID=A0A6G9VW89_9BACT|nr:UDP-N-acetylmuramoyl-tripeptide--D-alanyl-D-alanine ligase [Sulfurospirillum diekertiae]QIR77213.1 UDP-N-acetylmuramoyl-tripeptide--D-alanyl-D-alanine ligase [Sulfurospirillum diekertiae]QIR79827.1 UDP-N-acetylmuramoyl-tripeptide--D-alanyl-D-alanine ligase [Sulfurospirillum diekertiae]
MEIMVTSITHLCFILGLSYYFIIAMQWYSYRLERILFHYNRYDWHVFYFLVPLVGYYLLNGVVLSLFVALFLISLFIWQKKMDKKLVWTARVKRFFLFLVLATLFQDLLCTVLVASCLKLGVIIPLMVAQIASMFYEKMLFLSFKKEAQKKLMANSALKVVAITASYGKTSIKNFLAQILSTKFNVYKTPRSVNTIGGIIKDINNDLPEQCDVYIVEAGARARGDIDEIARLVNPHIAVVGCIGEQHIEYFKTLENIRNTKMELLHSSRLEKAFVHESTNVKGSESILSFGAELSDVEASLQGLSFSMLLNGVKESFTCKLLGAFNAINIAAAIHVARTLGLSIEEIRSAVSHLEGVEHRLQKIEAGGKLIIDDSFNGNLEGMLSSYNLVSQHQGRKVIITPGIVESTEEANRILAKKIDDVFDLVMITGKINVTILHDNIHKAQKIIISDKSKLQETLSEQTYAGDVILFSNDAPTFL